MKCYDVGQGCNNDEKRLAVSIDDVGDVLTNFSPHPLSPMERGLSSSNDGWGKEAVNNEEWGKTQESQSFFDAHSCFCDEGSGASGSSGNGRERGMEEAKYSLNGSGGGAGWSEPIPPTTMQSFKELTGIITESDREDIHDAIASTDAAAAAAAAIGKRSQCLFKAPLPVETLMHERSMGDLLFIDCRPNFSAQDRFTSGMGEDDVDDRDAGRNDGSGDGGGEYDDSEDSAEEVDHRQSQKKNGTEIGVVSSFHSSFHKFCNSSIMTKSALGFEPSDAHHW